MDSILTSIKKLRGVVEEYEHFDEDFIIHINSVFFILSQIGVGPIEGFSIKDKEATWNDFLPPGSKLEIVKTYIDAKIHMWFDPPQSGTLLQALKDVIAECEWRLSVAVDFGGAIKEVCDESVY